MSTARTLAQKEGAYQIEKGPGGRNLCRWCKKEVEGRRVTFCSDACVFEWRIRSSAGFARQQVRKRDKGVCAECGRDTVKLRGLIQERIERDMGRCRSPGTPSPFVKLLLRLKLVQFVPPYMSRWNYGWQVRSLWQADHILEVVRGGGLCGLEGYQTLCTCCHKRKTKRLAQERALARRQSIKRTPPAEALPTCPS